MPSSRNRARFSPGRAEFERRDIGVGVTTEIGVSPEDAIEIRHLMLTNYSNRRRRIEVTSYVELVLWDNLRQVILRHAPSTPLEQPGGIFLRSAEPVSDEDLTLLFAVARVVLVAARGPLGQAITLGDEGNSDTIDIRLGSRGVGGSI